LPRKERRREVVEPVCKDSEVDRLKFNNQFISSLISQKKVTKVVIAAGFQESQDRCQEVDSHAGTGYHFPAMGKFSRLDPKYVEKS
jgi:hypothetical protein